MNDDDDDDDDDDADSNLIHNVPLERSSGTFSSPLSFRPAKLRININTVEGETAIIEPQTTF